MRKIKHITRLLILTHKLRNPEKLFTFVFRYLNFINIDILKLPLHLFHAVFHGRHGGMSVFERLVCKVCLFHVEGLASQVVELLLVHLLLLEDPHGLGLDGVFARALSHLAHLVTELAEVIFECRNFLFDAFCSRVDLRQNFLSIALLPHN